MLVTIVYPWVPGRMKGIVEALKSLEVRPVPFRAKDGSIRLIVPAAVEQDLRTLAYLGLCPELPDPIV